MTVCEVCGKTIWVGAVLTGTDSPYISAWIHEQVTGDDHAARPAPRLPLQLAVPMCPECWAGKHANCDGKSWDATADDFAPCPCAQNGHQGEQEGASQR